MDYTNLLAQYIRGPRQQEQQTREQQQQQALVEALRGFGSMGQQQGGTPMQAGNIVGANANGSGLVQGAQLGGQLGQVGQGLWDKYQPTTALRYGTTPGSQQTSMLAAQDAGF